MQTPANSDVDLLLIGKTGNGKSATGNSILQRKVFASSATMQSVTTKVSWDVSNHNDTVIKVVDGPGIGDTRMTSEEGLNLFLNAMEFAVMANSQGYHAFLLVLRFGSRFTKEEQDTVRLLKQVFGTDFVRDYCVLVMTYGDSFNREAEEHGYTFDQWCGQQSGTMQELLRECEGRVVLFDNVTKDANLRNQQVNKLLSMVNQLKFQGRRYTDANFQRASDARDRVRVEAKKPIIQDETMCQISLILQKLQKIQSAFNSPNQLQDLQALELETERLVGSIAQQDKGTGALSDISTNAQSILTTVRAAVSARKRLDEERSRAQQEELERAAQLQCQRDDMQRQMEQGQSSEVEALRNRIKELEDQGRRAREEREQQIEIRQNEELSRLGSMTQDNQRAFLDVHIKVDKNLFDTLISFTRGIFTTIASWFGKN